MTGIKFDEKNQREINPLTCPRYFTPEQRRDAIRDANQPNSENFDDPPGEPVAEGDQDHWSSPNGCHPDCPMCEFETMGEKPPLTAEDLKGGL